MATEAFYQCTKCYWRGFLLESGEKGWNCPKCGERFYYEKPEPEVDTEWLLREVEAAFFSMWSANYGIDTKKEKEALELIKELIKERKKDD